jgi:hemoglobin
LSNESQSLFHRIGGQDALSKIVFEMYKLVLDDPKLAPFFKDVPMDRLKRMNTEFIASALGGPTRYSGAELVAIHRGRGIHREHFSKFVGHLATALADHGVNAKDIDDVLGRIAMSAGKITGDANVDG